MTKILEMNNSIYDNNPIEYSELRKGWMFYEKQLILLEFINSNKISKCLEFGSGTGDFISSIYEKFGIKCYGYDINKGYIKYSKYKHKNISFYDNFNDLLDKEYDIIYINDVIHHFKTEKEFVEKIMQLKFKYLFILEPNQFNPYICFFQYKTIGERNFIQKNFEKEIFKIKELKNIYKGFKFIFPNNIKNKTKIMNFLNSKLEDNILLGGSVFYIIKNKFYER